MNALQYAMKRQPRLARWACHIRQRLVDRRLSLLTGAGISTECGAPQWPQLVRALSNEVPGFRSTFKRHREANVQDTLLTQFIHSRYIDEYLQSKKGIPQDHILIRARIEWYNAIRKILYKKIPNDIDQIIKTHPYIERLARLCVKCQSTITFNFDDILDQIASKVTPDYALPPKTTWHLPAIESSTVSHIYHINGLLPQMERKKSSDHLIFTEDSFLQVIYGGTSNNPVMHSFTNSTYLLIGLSLNDHSLKSILATNAARSPGSIHYMIHWMSSDAALTAKQRDDISRANFEMYNLVTIFLTSEQIAEFLDLVQTGVERGGVRPTDAMDEAFSSALREYSSNVPVRYRYYIAGPVGSGKSTLLENLRSFRTLEEWPEKTPPELYQDHKLLSPDQRVKVNDWIYRQLKIKNHMFLNCGPGIHVMDRAPLDLFAFSMNEAENVAKAHDIAVRVEADGKLADGVLVLVVASSAVLLERQLRRGRIPTTIPGGMAYDGASLDDQRRALELTYPGAKIYSSEECNAHVLAKRVIADILFSDYQPLDMTSLNASRSNPPPKRASGRSRAPRRKHTSAAA